MRQTEMYVHGHNLQSESEGESLRRVECSLLAFVGRSFVELIIVACWYTESDRTSPIELRATRKFEEISDFLFEKVRET